MDLLRNSEALGEHKKIILSKLVFFSIDHKGGLFVITLNWVEKRSWALSFEVSFSNSGFYDFISIGEAM